MEEGKKPKLRPKSNKIIFKDISKITGIPLKEINIIMDAYFYTVKTMLKDMQKIYIRDVGTLVVKKRKKIVYKDKAGKEFTKTTGQKVTVYEIPERYLLKLVVSKDMIRFLTKKSRELGETVRYLH